MSISNLYIDQGAEFSTTLVINGSNNTPLTLSGYTITGHIRKTYSSSSYVPFSFELLTGTPGGVEASLTSAITKDMNPGLYVYDIVLKDNTDNSLTRVIEGTANVSPGVTQL
jgi:hypothetical protein